MSCKEESCGYDHQPENVCCAVCPTKDSCEDGFCALLPSPDDCSGYESCENYQKPIHDALFKLYRDSLHFVTAEHPDDLEILWDNFGMKMEDVGKQFFFAQYVHIVYCSGFKYQIVKDKWEAICKVYKDFDYAKVDWHRDSVEMEAMEEGMIRHQGKVKAILDTAHWLKEISNTGFLRFLEAGLKDIDTFKKLGYLGNKTKYHMGICLGFDVVKPDTHLEKIADHFKLPPLELCQLVADKYGVPIRLVDALFWRASEQGKIKEGVFVQDS